MFCDYQISYKTRNIFMLIMLALQAVVVVQDFNFTIKYQAILFLFVRKGKTFIFTEHFKNHEWLAYQTIYMHEITLAFLAYLKEMTKWWKVERLSVHCGYKHNDEETPCRPTLLRLCTDPSLRGVSCGRQRTSFHWGLNSFDRRPC